MAGSTIRPLSKKDLQEALKSLATKQDLQSQSKELKAHAVEQTHELARIINGSFQEQHDYMECKSSAQMGQNGRLSKRHLEPLLVRLG